MLKMIDFGVYMLAFSRKLKRRVGRNDVPNVDTKNFGYLAVSVRDNRVARDRNCSTSGVVVDVRFTAGHKTQTVFGAPADARVCPSVSRHTLFLKSSPSFAHSLGHYSNRSHLHSSKY